MKTYEQIENSDKQLKIEVFYSKARINYLNNKLEPRGYWLSIRTVNIENRPDGIIIETYEMYGGRKYFLLEVKRQSDKAYIQACKIAESKKEELKKQVLNIA